MRYLLESMHVLNGLLVVAVATAAYFAVVPFMNLEIKLSLPQAKKAPAGTREMAAAPQNSSPADYAVISDQNLFHPERKIPPEKKDEKATARPEVILYGTVITADTAIAFVEDKNAPYTTPGRGKRQRAVKKGDYLSGYTLQQIEANQIVLVKGDERLVVMLDDGQKIRSSETTSSPAALKGMPGLPTTATPGMPSGPQQAPSAAVSAPQGTPSAPQAITPTQPGAGTPGSRPATRRERVDMLRQIRGQ